MKRFYIPATSSMALAAAVVLTIGCTTTTNLSYPSNPHTSLDEIPAHQELRIELVNGAKLKVSHVVADRDSLTLFMHEATKPSQRLHRNDVKVISKRRFDTVKTVVLLGGIVAVSWAIGGAAEDATENALDDMFADWDFSWKSPIWYR